MYYPKNQIETGLYSNSDFVIISTNKVYIGPYFKTSDGKFFSGKEPNDGPNYALKKTNPNNPDNFLGAGAEIRDPRYDGRNNTVYSVLTNVDSTRPTIFTPIPYYPILTDVEKGNGQFIRYILKKSNENLYYEVGSENFVTSNRNNLYMRIPLPWIIAGEKEMVAKANAKQVELIEKNMRIVGLGKFLKHNYLQFYQG
jgi:hypothetical protein